MHAEQFLEKFHDLTDAHPQCDAENHAGQCTEESRKRALYHKNLHHAARSQAQCTQNRYIGLLLRNRHDQRRNKIKCCHCDNQRQDNEHHTFFQLDRLKITAVVKRPVAHPYFVLLSRRNQVGDKVGRILGMGQFQAQPADIFTKPV